MKQLILLPSFLHSYKKLAPEEKKILAKALEQFNHFILTGESPLGLHYKKINHDKYEFRVGLRLRVIVKEESHIIYLVFIGSHDDVERYMRRFRNR